MACESQPAKTNDGSRRFSRLSKAAAQRDAATRALIAFSEDSDRMKRQLQTEIDSLRQSLRMINASRSVQVAKVLRGATQSWKTMCMLPVELFRVACSRDQRYRRSAMTKLPDIDPTRPAADSSVEETFHRKPHSGAALRVMGILDSFTESGMIGECELFLPTPETSLQRVSEFSPHVFFVESAWHGNSGSWAQDLHPASPALLRLLDYCRSNQIKTVFWNKEDPAHFSRFIGLAAHFDHVLTTDADCIDAYRQRLRTMDVSVFPFACQPRKHNPIQLTQRKLGFVFAGSYYHQYPQRCEDFRRLVEIVSSVSQVDIFDRNHLSGVSDLQFPEPYRQWIRGGLSLSEVESKYKEYVFGLNVNTVRESSTMFSRRVVELLASGTIVVSNSSLGMKRLFGDLVLQDDDASMLIERIKQLVQDPQLRKRFVLLALRKVMSEHTWADRMIQLSELVSVAKPQGLPSVVVVSVVRSREEVERVIAMFRSQTYVKRSLLLVDFSRSGCVSDWVVAEDVVVLSRDDATRRTFRRPDAEALAAFHQGDAYGPNYLLDLVLASRYADVAIVGKAAWYRVSKEEGAELVGEGKQYRKVSSCRYRSALLLSSCVFPETAADFADAIDGDEVIAGGTQLSIDEFNYCQGAYGVLPEKASDRSEACFQGLDIRSFTDPEGVHNNP